MLWNQERMLLGQRRVPFEPARPAQLFVQNQKRFSVASLNNNQIQILNPDAFLMPICSTVPRCHRETFSPRIEYHEHAHCGKRILDTMETRQLATGGLRLRRGNN